MGVAPSLITASALEIIVKFGIITSSPGPTPIALSAISKAAVPFDTAIECFLLINLEKFASKIFTSGPSDEIHPFFITFIPLVHFKNVCLKRIIFHINLILF